MAKPGGPQLCMGDDVWASEGPTLLRLVAKTNKRLYLVDSDSNEYVVGLPASFVKTGRATLAAGTTAIDFSSLGLLDEDDTEYSILLSGDQDETFRWADKTETGFTINSSYGGSTANVDWQVLRTE